MMITPPITAEVMENPMKTPAWDIQKEQANINQNTYQWRQNTCKWIRSPPLFLHQTEPQRAEKLILATAPPPIPPYLKVWMTPPSPYLKVWIHCIHEGRSSFQVHKQSNSNNKSQSAIMTTNTVFKSERLQALANCFNCLHEKWSSF